MADFTLEIDQHVKEFIITKKYSIIKRLSSRNSTSLNVNSKSDVFNVKGLKS